MASSFLTITTTISAQPPTTLRALCGHKTTISFPATSGPVTRSRSGTHPLVVPQCARCRELDGLRRTYRKHLAEHRALVQQLAEDGAGEDEYQDARDQARLVRAYRLGVVWPLERRLLREEEDWREVGFGFEEAATAGPRRGGRGRQQQQQQQQQQGKSVRFSPTAPVSDGRVVRHRREKKYRDHRCFDRSDPRYTPGLHSAPRGSELEDTSGMRGEQARRMDGWDEWGHDDDHLDEMMTTEDEPDALPPALVRARYMYRRHILRRTFRDRAPSPRRPTGVTRSGRKFRR